LSAREATIRVAEAGALTVAAFLPLSIVGAQLGGGLLLLGVLLAALSGSRGFLPRGLALPVGAFALAGLSASIVSPVDLPLDTFTANRPILLLLLVPAVFGLTSDPERLLRRLVVAVALAATLAAVLGLVQHQTGFDLNHALGVRAAPLQIEAPSGTGYAAIGTFNSRLTFAAIEAAVLMLMTALALCRIPVSLRALCAGAVAAVGLSVLASFARAAWMGLAAGAATLALGLGRRGLSVVAATAVVAAAAGAALPSVRERATSTLSATANADRRFIWSRAVEVISDHPVHGVGVYGYPVAAAPYYDRVDPLFPMRTWAHDMPLTLLAESGLAGLFTWVWMFAVAIGLSLGALRNDRPGWVRAARLGSLGAAAALLTTSLFHDVLYDGEAAMALFFFSGLSAARLSSRAPAEKVAGADPPKTSNALLH
jgi:O-antigen ligase